LLFHTPKILCLLLYSVLNKNLREVGKLAGLSHYLILHSSRHTFADQLHEATGDIKMVQEALSHTQIQATQRYIANRKQSRVDKANVVYSRFVQNPDLENPTETLLKHSPKPAETVYSENPV